MRLINQFATMRFYDFSQSHSSKDVTRFAKRDIAQMKIVDQFGFEKLLYYYYVICFSYQNYWDTRLYNLAQVHLTIPIVCEAAQAVIVKLYPVYAFD